MKIIFFTGSMGKGGAERVLSIASRMYVSLGHEVTIVSVLEDKISYKLSPQVRYKSIARPQISRFFNIFYWIKSIRKIARNERPDVIISFFTKINFLVLLAKVYKKSKLFVFERHNPNDEYSFYSRILSHLLYPKANKVVLQTKAAYSFMSEKVRKNSIILMNPLDLEVPVCTRKLNRIVAIGRLVPVKNHEILIKSFAKFRKKCDEKFSLHIYGEGELKGYLLQLIRDENLLDCVFLEGAKDNIFDEIKDAKIFVIPSNSEGLSNALLEAMSMGFVVIGSDISGINTVISDGVNGYLFNKGSIESLTEVLERAINDYGQSQIIGMEARRYIMEEYLRDTNQKWLDLINI